MTANPLQHKDAPGETRTPNLLIRSQTALSDARLEPKRVIRLTRWCAWPEDVTKRPYSARKSPLSFPRTRALLGALILTAILLALSL